MSELEPKHIAALRRLREEQVADLRKQEGRAFSPAEVEQFLRKFEQQHGPLPTTEKPAVKSPTIVNLLEQWRSLLLRFALPVTAVLVVGIVILSSLPSWDDFAVAPGDRGGSTQGKPVLPVLLRVNLEKLRIEFRGDGDRLAGTLTESNALSTVAVAVYQVSAQGKDSTGLEAKFEGVARFTRTVPGSPIKRKADVTTVVVEGDLNFGAAGRFPVQRTYLP
jgi:hypothetical protein